MRARALTDIAVASVSLTSEKSSICSRFDSQCASYWFVIVELSISPATCRARASSRRYFSVNASRAYLQCKCSPRPTVSLHPPPPRKHLVDYTRIRIASLAECIDHERLVLEANLASFVCDS